MLSELLARADRELAENKLGACEETCASILSQDPGNPTATLVLGIVRLKTDRIESAVEILQTIAGGPLAGQANLWLSRCHRRAGRLAEAAEAAERAVAASPSQPVLLHQWGTCLLDLGQPARALERFEAATRLDPRSAGSLVGQASCLLALGRGPEAEAVLRRAPRSPKVLEMLYTILSDGVDTAGAADCARSLLAMSPESAESQLRLARALLSDSDAAGAEKHLEIAERFGLNKPESLFGAGSVHMGLGRTEQATRYFRRSIEAGPRQGWAYAALAFNHGLDYSNEIVEQMRTLAADSGLSPMDRAYVHFGLGRQAEDAEDYGLAMFHYDEGNRLLRESDSGLSFDQDAYREWIDRLPERPLEGVLEAGGGPTPVFVVGMPRSGTTLLDQMLTMHPDIGSLGEQGFWLRNASLPASGSRALYGELMARRAGGRRWAVDKMPDNYAVLPSILAAFPNAKIVHIARDPADTGLSNYSTLNRLKVGWARRQEDIVFVYEQYRRVVARWKGVLPAGSFMDVEYEDLIRDSDRTMGAVLEFLGARWEAGCTHPEMNPRAVATPSAWQVRQPINARSIGRARRFQPYLGALGRLIGA